MIDGFQKFASRWLPGAQGSASSDEAAYVLRDFVPGTCEACEHAPATIAEPCDDVDEPYHLCGPCHHRLLARALRPAEWYNLAKRHGWYMYLLHDDFYDQDGTAGSPEEDVEQPGRFPPPVLAAVVHSPETLLEYTLTRWHPEPAVVEAWEALPAAAVLEALERRYDSTRNAGIRGTILEVCAALGAEAADFVRRAWTDLGDTVELFSLARATAACLPFREGYDRVLAEVDTLEPPERRRMMMVLGDFHTPETLDWIEVRIESPVTDQWGFLAANAGIGWPRVERWLAGGRPLSLAALDALLAIARAGERPAGAHRPRLADPPAAQVLVDAVAAYARLDAVPRVERSAGEIVRRVGEIVRPA